MEAPLTNLFLRTICVRAALFIHELLKELSGKYNKGIAQVVLRWFIQREVSAIQKSVNKRLRKF